MLLKKEHLSDFESSFDKTWISKLHERYLNVSKDVNNKSFHSSPGDHAGRNNRTIEGNISNYFDRLLYSPNIAVLDYVIKNLSLFKNLTFLDNGASFGVLSIFLKKLGINCYNFDTFVQMKDLSISQEMFDKNRNDFCKHYQVEASKNTIPDENFDVLVSSGIWVDQLELLTQKFKYILYDSQYRNHGDNKLKFHNYEKIEEYAKLLYIYKLEGLE